MPWKETTKMELRLEFAKLADREEANMSRLCRRFDISRSTGYKWLRRYRSEGKAGLKDRSRQPHTSPGRTPGHIEGAVCAVREKHPAWGGRKIRAVLRRQAEEAGEFSFGPEAVPAASTITAILRRRGQLREEDTDKAAGHERFEKERPNALWQMDFKGDFLLEGSRKKKRCYPLTVVDDHSRFAVALKACGDQQRETVQEHLREAFRRYGLPKRIITDHGAPWGVGMTRPDGRSYYTRLSAWLMRLGISVSFTARAHPQTNGKNERFNQSLQAEVLRFESYSGLPGYQERFDRWRDTYNLQRPHEALGMDVPASRYEVSRRPYPEELPPVGYGAGEQEVRKVHTTGYISFRSRRFKVGKAFGGHLVALRPAQAGEDGTEWKVYFCHQHVRTIDFDQPPR
jgi:transposase InsO family protein